VRRQNILFLGILLFAFVQQVAFAQCGQTSEVPAVSTTPNDWPSPTTSKRDSADRIVLLQLEIGESSVARSAEIFGDPGKLRTAAISAAVKFANAQIDRTSGAWPLITLAVKFPQNGHGAPEVRQTFVSGVPACVAVDSVISVAWPSASPAWPSAPPVSLKFLLDVKPIMPVLTPGSAKSIR
jgi:hypothetical protein